MIRNQRMLKPMSNTFLKEELLGETELALLKDLKQTNIDVLGIIIKFIIEKITRKLTADEASVDPLKCVLAQKVGYLLRTLKDLEGICHNCFRWCQAADTTHKVYAFIKHQGMLSLLYNQTNLSKYLSKQTGEA